MYRMMRRKAERLAPEVIDFAQRLVRTPGRSLEERKVADLVEATMRDIGYDEVLRDEYGNVVALLHGREGQPTLLLNSHMDTASSGDPAGWTRPPESGEIEEGRLHGLGAADCKGGLAAQVYAGALLKRSLLPLRGNLLVAATVGQEEAHSLGVRKLMQETLPGMEMMPSCVVLGEPSGLGLYYGHDGWVELEVCVEGSNPFQVEDAAEAVRDFLRRRMESTERRSEAWETFSLRGVNVRDEDGRRRAVIAVKRRLFDRELLESAMGELELTAGVAGQLAGGVAVSVGIRRDRHTCYTGRMTEVRHITNAWSIDPYHPLVERARGALRAAGATPRVGRWRLGRPGMGTAGDVFVNDFGVPAVGYGPGDEEVCHRPDEYVETSKIAEALYGTAVIAQAVIGYPVFGWTSDEI